MPASPSIVITDDEDDNKGQKAPTAGQDTSAAAECVICYEPYSENGDHRPAALKCGHLAGESCLRKWLQSSRFCPNCRKSAKAKDLVPLFNLPTLVVAANGAAPAAAAAAANPSELALKEMMLQKVQRAYSEKEKEVQQRAEEARRQTKDAQRQGRERKRLAEEALVKEQENKRLRRELEDMQRQLAALRQQQAGAAPAGALTNPDPNVMPHPAQPHPRSPPGQSRQPPQPSSLGYSGAAGCGPSLAAFLGAPPAGSMWGYFPGAQPVTGLPHHSAGGMHWPLQQQQQQQQPLLHQVGARELYGGGPSGIDAGGGGSSGRGPALAGASGRPGGDVAGGGGGGSGLFSRLFTVPVEGCRLVALDVAGARVLVSEMPGGSGGGGSGSSCIRKISMLSPESFTRIRLPSSAGIVYDMQLPSGAAAAGGGGSGGGGGQHFLAVATQGAGLCLACPRSDSIVATFTGLPYRAWCCSWVPQSGGGSSSGGGGEHLLLAGMDKGHIALLDTRRTDRPVGVLAVLQHQAASGCAQLPVRTLAALPRDSTTATHGSALTGAAAVGGGSSGSHGGVLWPTCALSCSKGAWLMMGGSGGAAPGGDGGGGAMAEAPVPALIRLDGGGGAAQQQQQLESLSVTHHSDWAWNGGGGLGGPGGGQPCWHAAMSWRPAGGGGAGAGAGVEAAGPRHDVGLLRACGWAPYHHEATVTDYTRRGLQTVRSCLIPCPSASAWGAHPPHPHAYGGPFQGVDGGGGLAGGGGRVLLVSSDDDTRQPLIWSLGGGGGGGGGGHGGGHVVVQRLDPHPDLPTCMVAAGGGGGGGGGAAAACYLACGSSSRVVLYRRRDR